VAFTDRLTSAGVLISVDSRRRVQDNIFIERLWRSVKYEEVYLTEYANGWRAEERLARYFDFYRHRRVHQALGYRTPAEVCHARVRKKQLEIGRRNWRLDVYPARGFHSAAGASLRGVCWPLTLLHLIQPHVLPNDRVPLHSPIKELRLRQSARQSGHYPEKKTKTTVGRGSGGG
jgi:hypothetical protein